MRIRQTPSRDFSTLTHLTRTRKKGSCLDFQESLRLIGLAPGYSITRDSQTCTGIDVSRNASPCFVQCGRRCQYESDSLVKTGWFDPVDRVVRGREISSGF